MIPLHVIYAIGVSTLRDIEMWSSDTDVLILLMDVVAHGRLGAITKLNFLTGKDDKYRSIYFRERVNVIVRETCQDLSDFHNITGADRGGKFVDISKKSWITSYLFLPMMTPSSLPSNSLVKGCSQDMNWWTVSCPKKCGPSRSLFDQYTAPGGATTIPAVLLGSVHVQESGEREASSDKSNTDAPYHTYQHCGYEGQRLYNTSPMPTASRGNGLILAGDEYVPVRCIYKAAPVAVMELMHEEPLCKGREQCFLTIG